MARCTLCDKVCQWLATGRWFSPGAPVSSINKTDCHDDITEILLKVPLNTLNQTPKLCSAMAAMIDFWLTHKNRYFEEDHPRNIPDKVAFQMVPVVSGNNICRHCSHKIHVKLVVQWHSSWVLQLPMQSVPITIKVVSSNPAHGEVYSLQHYVINFVRDLWQVSDFENCIWIETP